MSFTVEKCTLNDWTTISGAEEKYIECAWSAENIRNLLQSEMYSCYKACDESANFLGYGSVQWCPPEGNVCNIAVETNARRQGVAGAILLAIEDEAKKKGVTELFLEVNENNSPAIRLYEKSGFSVIGKRPKYYGNDAAVMMKKEI